MAFWGVEVKPGKPFTHNFDDSKGRLHVSLATLGFGNASPTIKSLLQCNVGNKSPVLLCSLSPEKSESLQLNLEFEEVDEVIFSVIGPRGIHLSGYYLGSARIRSLPEESESFGEDIADTDSQKSCHSDEDSYDDSFINDDEPEVFPPSSVSTSEVEESWDDKKPLNRKRGSKRKLRKTYQVSESEDEECSEPKKNTNGISAVPILKSDDEDNCPISTYMKNGTSANKELQNGGKIVDELVSKTNKKKQKDGTDNNTKLKQKMDDSATDGQLPRQSDLLVDSLPISKNGHKDSVILKKKRKERSESDKFEGDNALQSEAKVESNREVQQMSKIDNELADNNDRRPKKKSRKESKNEKKYFEGNSCNIINDVKENKEEQDGTKEVKESEEKKVKKKKKKNKKKIDKSRENEESVNVETPQLPVEKNTSQVRTLQNGLVIEDLESSKEEGRVAISGKKISIRFVSKLKDTEQIVDSNTEDDLFKFRLGANKVIEAWEVGLEGMRVGEKRRLTVPPQMGYGSKGDGKNIPPDSWLVCEIELVKVR